MALAHEIHQLAWPDDGGVRAALARVIFEREARSPGLRVSNVGGWHSHPDLLTWPDAPNQELRERIRIGAAAVGAEELRVQAWASVLRDGAYQVAHRHGEAVWSGVYYVDAGDGAGGTITFARGAASCRFTPRDGLMLIFPGSLLHSVEAYDGTSARIAVAFNLFR